MGIFYSSHDYFSGWVLCCVLKRVIYDICLFMSWWSFHDLIENTREFCLNLTSEARRKKKIFEQWILLVIYHVARVMTQFRQLEGHPNNASQFHFWSIKQFSIQLAKRDSIPVPPSMNEWILAMKSSYYATIS